MNKGEFIKAIAQKTNSTLKAATSFFDAYQGIIAAALKKGEKVALVGFGTYEARKRPARTGINPMTKAKIKIAATTVPVLKFGKSFKAEIVSKKK